MTTNLGPLGAEAWQRGTDRPARSDPRIAPAAICGSSSARGHSVLCSPTGMLLWVSDGDPGSLHDPPVAREHVLAGLHWAAAYFNPLLADGYEGVGIVVHIPATHSI